MKIFQSISWAIILIGLAFRFLHYPMAAIITLLGIVLLFVVAFIYVFKCFGKSKKDVFFALFHFSVAFITLYLFFRLQFWAYSKIVFIYATLLTLSYFIVYFIKTKKFKIRFPQVFLFVYFVMAIAFWNIRSYQIFYVVNMNRVLNNEEIMHNYERLNTYSWFLYLADKKEEALEFNKYAQKALENSPEYGFSSKTKNCLIQGLQQQEEQIRNGTWIDPDYYEYYSYSLNDKE